MANQSFPPRTILSAMKSFRVALRISGFEECFDNATLLAKVADGLRAAGFTVYDDAADMPNAHISVYVGVMAAGTTSPGGAPVGFAYACHAEMQTPVAGQPFADLFCIWSDLTFGVCRPMTLAACVLKTLGEITGRLTKALAEIQSPPAST